MSTTKTSSKKSASNATNIGLKTDVRRKSAALLAGILGDQHVIYIKTRNFHWNLTGPRFDSLHAFLEEQYKELEAAIDETAERIRMLGETSPGSMKELLGLATIKETPGKPVNGETAVEILKNDHEEAVRMLRKAISDEETLGDVGTEDFLTGLIQAHEKAAWMLRSFLE